VFNVPFQHSYIWDERSGVESYPYPVSEGLRYINLNPVRLFIQQPAKKGKGSRGSFKLLHQRRWPFQEQFRCGLHVYLYTWQTVNWYCTQNCMHYIQWLSSIKCSIHSIL